MADPKGSLPSPLKVCQYATLKRNLGEGGGERGRSGVPGLVWRCPLALAVLKATHIMSPATGATSQCCAAELKVLSPEYFSPVLHLLAQDGLLCIVVPGCGEEEEWGSVNFGPTPFQTCVDYQNTRHATHLKDRGLVLLGPSYWILGIPGKNWHDLG